MVCTVGLAGSARLELVSGVVQLRPEDAMFEAMLRGWRNQQRARRLQAKTISDRENLIRRFLGFVNDYPWQWAPVHMDEWSAQLAAEQRLAPSSVRNYQGTVQLFTEFLTDPRYGWAAACEEAFGTHPVAICHEWNTLPHLQGYEGDPEARPFTVRNSRRSSITPTTRWSGRSGRAARARWPPTGTPPCSRCSTPGGCAALSAVGWILSTSAATRTLLASVATARSTFGTGRRSGASRRGGATCCR